MNIAAMNGQETHVHWHVHPRYDKPVTIAGEMFEDTQWYPRKEKIDHVVDKEVLQVVAEKIRENL
jgi:diadenosine tetraphosphate (Ap4A) HIT family hydrolase